MVSLPSWGITGTSGPESGKGGLKLNSNLALAFFCPGISGLVGFVTPGIIGWGLLGSGWGVSGIGLSTGGLGGANVFTGKGGAYFPDPFCLCNAGK